jgi:hypothetical protein
MSPEQLDEILNVLCEAGPEGPGGFRDLPEKVRLTLYAARNGVGLTVPTIEAVARKGLSLHARTAKGELYVVQLEDVFAANVDGKVKPKSERKAGFG